MHTHAHDHSHGHHHAHQRMTLAFWLNLVFALIELVGGVLANSFAVSSNALHDLGDALALALSMVLEKKSHRKSDSQYSYGYRRYSIASAFLTSVFLVSGSCLVIFFGVQHLWQPLAPDADKMIGLSVLGISINAFSLWSLRKGHSLNERVLSWHFVEDTLSWLMVLLTSVLIHWTHWNLLDAVLGIFLSLWILYNVQKNLKELLNIFLQAAPKDISSKKIEHVLSSIPAVQNIHHIHLWTLDGQIHILTAHILLKKNQDLATVSKIKSEIKALLKNQFGIAEATLEFESQTEFCEDPEHQ